MKQIPDFEIPFAARYGLRQLKLRMVLATTLQWLRQLFLR